MHWSTKFFVFLAGVLSLALSALTVTYSVNADRIAGALSDAVQAEQAASSALTIQASAHAEEVAGLRNDLDSREQQIAGLRQDLRQFERDKLALEAQIRESEAKVTAVQGQLSEFGIGFRTMSALLENNQREVSLLRDAALASRTERLDLEDRLADLQSENQVLDQTVRALREQVADAQRALENNRAGVAGTGAGLTLAGSASAPRDLAGPTIIEGRIEDVRFDEVGDRTLVQVDLGQNDGVFVNAKLYVVRGATYVATLVMQRVDLQGSVGYVEVTNNNLRVQPGDVVRSAVR